MSSLPPSDICIHFSDNRKSCYGPKSVYRFRTASIESDSSRGGSLERNTRRLINEVRRRVSRSGQQPVAEIVPNTQPDFARPSGELRLDRRASRADVPEASPPTSEGCLDVAREASEVGPQFPPDHPTYRYARAAYIGVSGRSLHQNR
jgi:hypothetical protein